MLGAEMDIHLAEEAEHAAGNHRSGTSPKTVDTGSERIVLDIPRDRQGRFDPVLIGKYQRRFPGFDDKIIAMYARGMSTRDIQAHIEEIYCFQGLGYMGGASLTSGVGWKFGGGIKILNRPMIANPYASQDEGSISIGVSHNLCYFRHLNQIDD